LAHCATCLSPDLLYQLSPVVRRSLSILATCGPRALVLVAAGTASINQWLVPPRESHTCPTSSRSTGFCAIWDCISSSSHVQMCTTDTLRQDRARRPLHFGEQALPRALGTGTTIKKPQAPATRAGLFRTARVSIQVPRCMLLFAPRSTTPLVSCLCSLFRSSP